jgi:signal peptidase I
MGRAKSQSKGTARRRFSGLWDTVRTLIYAVLAALVVRTVAIEPFNIPSGSMIPTLLVGDYLFVSKYAYGYSRHSLPWAVSLFDGRILDSPPERGDVAVFKLPSDNETDYIKRIVGLPGDRLQVVKGVLHINGAPVKRERVDDYSYRDRYGRERVLRQYQETLPNGTRYMTLDATPTGSLDNTQIYTVPPDHYFAMGDNRDSSLDSRVRSVGFIPAENLVGRAEFIFHSLADGVSIGEVWNWPSATRSERIFQAID